MSSQRTMDQERAAAAWNAIDAVNKESEDFKKKYAGWVRSAPADVMTNGLGQTLAFMLAKGKGKDTEAPSLLYRHLSEWVCPKMEWGQASLLEKLIEPDSKSDVYRRAMTEALAYLVWLKRFAEAVLPEVADVGE
ncbi:MAG TPA: type III-B CRISPR module-associated protein Cmr5 [Chloroflexi bacterium]|nr:type III-B CRISPR module-associated protein Cmr5 [Chloroflexota bacterium]